MSAAIYFRNTPFAACVRALSGGRILPYPPTTTKASILPLTEPAQWSSEGLDQGGEASQEKSSEEAAEHLVEWEGENDPENPKNFPTWAKALIAFQVSAISLALLCSNAVADKPDWLAHLYCDCYVLHIYRRYDGGHGNLQLQSARCSTWINYVCCRIRHRPSGMTSAASS